MKKLKLIGVLLLTVVVTGCALKDNKTTNGVTQNQPSVNVTSTVSETKILNNKTVKDVIYSSSDLAPLLRDGKVYGFLKLNQVEKLGIWNWQDPDCTQSPIRHSYTLNFTAKYLENLEPTEKIMFYVKPYVTDLSGDKIIGKPCIVGWSGFPEHPIFNSDTRKAYFEYGVQPSHKITKNNVLRLKIKDSEGREYDDVLFSHKVFKNPKKGRSLIEPKDSVCINSLNGGRYKIDIKKVYKENNYVDVSHYLSSSDLPKYPALMFTTKITYLKAPDKSKGNPRYDVADDNTLRTSLDIGVQTNLSEKIQFENKPTYVRAKYNDTDETELYVLKNFVKIHEGYYVMYNNNREITESDLKKADSARFILHLDSEVTSLPPDQIMNFDGRFIVFQEQITQRKLYSSESNRTEFNKLGTNDKNAKKDR